MTLQIKNLSCKIENKLILDKINLEIKKGELVVIVGKNGEGKSTILNSIMKINELKIISNITLGKKNLSKLKTEEIAQSGIFLSSQNPIEIPGITFLNFLKLSYKKLVNEKIKMGEFIKILNEKIKIVGFDNSFRGRFFNVGFSGGEKKKSELLQLLLFKPKFALLDEIDSGLDINSVNLVNSQIKELQKKRKNRFFNYKS